MPTPCHALLAALLALPPAPQAPRDTVTLVIAATTDVHGRVFDWDYERDRPAPLGLIRAATVVDSLRRAHPGRVVLVDAGDLIQGNPFATYFARVAPRRPHPILETMNRMGYDAAAPGNHEFNFGLEVMRRALADARFPYVSANIIDARTRRTVYPAGVLVRKAGIAVGIVGATTPGVLVWDMANVAGRVTLTGVAEAVPDAVADLRRRGADVTLVVAHAGLDGASSYPAGAAPPENDMGAALRAAGPDVAVIGHTHREIADSLVGVTLVVQPRNWVQSVAVATLRLVREGRGWRIVERQGRLVPLADVTPDSGLAGAMRWAHEAARGWAITPLGRSAAAMRADSARLVDTPVIDFINAVMRERSGADLSATAAFNTRGGLPEGVVTRADLAGIYPYDNTLTAVRVSGADLRAFLEHSARYWRGLGPAGPLADSAVPGYNFDLLSGAEYELDLGQPVGRRVAFLRVRGREVADTDSFTLALNNYRAQGGGGFAMLARARVVYDRGEDIRDLLGEELARRGTIRPEDYFVPNWRIRGVGPAAPSRTQADP